MSDNLKKKFLVQVLVKYEMTDNYTHSYTNGHWCLPFMVQLKNGETDIL